MPTIGVSKPYYAKYTENEGTVSYSAGGKLGKMTELNISIESSDSNDFYADNAISETDRSFAGGTIKVVPDDLTQEVSKELLGIIEQALGELSGITDEDVTELIYDDRQETPYLGVGFIVKKKHNGLYKWRAIILTKVMFSVPNDAAKTQGENIEWQTPELNGSILRDDTEHHMWKREATFTTEAQAETYIKARLNIPAA